MAVSAALADGRAVAETHPRLEKPNYSPSGPYTEQGPPLPGVTVRLRQVLPGLLGRTGSRPTGGEAPPARPGQRSRDPLGGWLQVSPQEESVTGPLLGFIVCRHLEVVVRAFGELHTWRGLTRERLSLPGVQAGPVPGLFLQHDTAVRGFRAAELT